VNDEKGLRGLQVASRHLTGFSIALELKRDLLTFHEFAHTCTFYSRDVNEGVSAAVVWLDKAETFGGIKPFYCASGHSEAFQSKE